MHLLNYTLYDLYALFVFLRNHPERFPCYKEGIQQIAALIETAPQETAPVNAIRHCLRPCYNSADSYMHFVTVDNEYTAEILFITAGSYYPLLSAIMQELIAHGNNKDRLSLLCDALHNIPIILVRHARPRRHIRFEIAHYRKIYNSQFLERELKLLP